MLPKAERLQKNKDFEFVFKLKNSVATNTIILYVELKNNAEDVILPKVGFVVGKKVHRHSTERNIVKRRMRESYRLLRKENPYLVQNFKTLIFIARPAIFAKDYQEIDKSIKDNLFKAKKFIKSTKC